MRSSFVGSIVSNFKQLATFSHIFNKNISIAGYSNAVTFNFLQSINQSINNSNNNNNNMVEARSGETRVTTVPVTLR